MSSIPDRDKNTSLFHLAHAGSAAHQTSYSTSNKSFRRRCKGRGADPLCPVSRLTMREVTGRSTDPRLHGVVLPQRKVHPTTCHGGTEGEYRYSSTLSLTSTLDGGAVNAMLQPLYPLYGRLDGPQGPSGVQRIWPNQDSIPGPSSP